MAGVPLRELLKYSRPKSIAEYFGPQMGQGIQPGVSAPNFGGQMPPVAPQNAAPPTGMGVQPGISAPQVPPGMQDPQGVQPGLSAPMPQQSAPAADVVDTNAGPPSMFSFMDKPGASDALVAFGASMLKAPTFNEGLADGAMAVNKVAREQRFPTDQEMARAKMIGKMTRAASGQSPYQKQDPIYVGSKLKYPVMNDQTGKYAFEDAPEDAVRGADAGLQNDAKLDNVFKDKLNSSVIDNYNTVRGLDNIIEKAPSISLGSGIWQSTKRQIMSLSGIDFGDSSLTNLQEVEKIIKDSELSKAQTQRGLGQFTEMEREIVAKSLPSLDTNKQAFIWVATKMKQNALIDRKILKEWNDNPKTLREQYGDFRSFAQNRYAAANERYLEDFQALINSVPGAGKAAATGGEQQLGQTPPAATGEDPLAKYY